MYSFCNQITNKQTNIFLGQVLSVHFPIPGIPCIQYTGLRTFSEVVARGITKCLTSVHMHSFRNQITDKQTNKQNIFLGQVLSVHFPITGIPCIQYAGLRTFSEVVARVIDKCLNRCHHQTNLGHFVKYYVRGQKVNKLVLRHGM